MKFLLVAPRFHTNLYYRVRALQDAGHTVKVAVLYQGKSEFYKNIDIQVLKLSFFSRLLSSIIKIFKKTYLKTNFEFRIEAPDNELNQIVKSYLPDVILLKAYQNLLALKTLVVAKKYHAKVLMFTQTNKTNILNSKFLFCLNIKLFKILGVTAYITPIKSNYTAFKNFGIENVYYIQFPYFYREVKLNVNKNEIKLLSIYKFIKNAKFEMIIDIIKILRNEYNLHLTLIGENVSNEYSNKIKRLIHDKKLEKYVTIKHNIEYEDMNKYYEEHDIFVIIGKSAAAYSIVEAMANGLAIISSDENGTKCYIEEGKNGYIFKAKSENDLYEKIKLCIEDKNKLKIMRQKSLQLHYQQHLPEQFTKKIISIVSR